MSNPLSFGYAGLSYLHFTNKIGTTLPFFLQKKKHQISWHATKVPVKSGRGIAGLVPSSTTMTSTKTSPADSIKAWMDTRWIHRCKFGRLGERQKSKGKNMEKSSSKNSPLLVGGFKFQPIWKICSSNWIISPGRGENKKYLSCHHLDYVNLSQGGTLFFQKPGASGGFVVISKSTICLIGLKLGVLLAFISQKWISCSQLLNNLESIKIIILIKRRVGLSVQGSPLDACCSNFWIWCPAEGMHHSCFSYGNLQTGHACV